MFSERRYARYDNDYDRRPTSALVWLLCALAAGFVIQMVFWGLFPGGDAFPISDSNALPVKVASFSPDALRHLRLWTLFSYTLLHGGFLHLLANGLVIYFMGREVLSLLGNKRFIAVTLASAAGGALLWFAVKSLNNAPPHTSLIGASAIAVAFLMLFACFYPDNPITVLVFFIIPVSIRPKTLAAIVIALDVFGLVFFEIPRREGGISIAHSAHLGGALVAFGYFFLVHRREWRNPDGVAAGLLPDWLRRKKPAAIASPKYKVNIGSAPAPAPRPENLRAEVDRILDKINAHGFASLTDQEKGTLDSARDILSRR